MPKKCDHLEDCVDCSKQIPEKPSEVVGRIQQILTTLETRQRALQVAVSNENRYKISLEAGLKSHRRAVVDAEKSVEQTRVQLATELRKFDQGLGAVEIPEPANA